MLPLLAGSIGAVYSAGKAIDSYRYWNDYYKRTGYRPKYPFKSGQYDFMKGMSATSMAFGHGLKTIGNRHSSSYRRYARRVMRFTKDYGNVNAYYIGKYRRY